MKVRIIGTNNLTGFVEKLLLNVIKDNVEKRKHLTKLLKRIFTSCIKEHLNGPTAQIIKLLEDETLKSADIVERIIDKDIDFRNDCLNMDYIEPEYDLGLRAMVFLLHKLGLDKEWKLALTIDEELYNQDNGLDGVYDHPLRKPAFLNAG